MPGMVVDKNIKVQNLGAFVSYILRPVPPLTVTAGLREEYYSCNKKHAQSPRASFSYQLTTLTSINGSTGIFYQNLPVILLAQHQDHLPLPKAVHYILGLSHLITENTQITLEAYKKEYSHFPIDPSQPSLFLID
jgi:hypothetical protein